jgi:hypothetical protein
MPARFNLGLVMRKLSGCGTPRGRQGRMNQIFMLFLMLVNGLISAITSNSRQLKLRPVTSRKIVTSSRLAELWPNFGPLDFQN